MRNGQRKLNEKSNPDFHKNQFLVKDILQYLSSLAKLNDVEKVGNPELSEGLRELVDALRPYGKRPVRELASALKETKPANDRRTSSRESKANLPSDLESVCSKEIEEILDNNDYTKSQIAELGYKRFGISKSRLERSRKEDAKQAIRTALANEKTLDVISQQARKSGAVRAF